MMNYLKIKIKAYSYEDFIHEYESKYKAEYQLIGYYYSAVDHEGELILYSRKK